MRARATCLAASLALASALPASAQTADVQDLGHGVYLALAVDGRHRPALEARLEALRWLDAHSGNGNERGWLAAAIRDAEARLK